MLECLGDRRPERGLFLYEKFAGPPEFVSYRDFPGRVAACAEFLRDQGVRPGTRVVFPFETSVPVIMSFLALMEIGAVPLSVKPLLMNTPAEAYRDFVGRIGRDFRADRVLAVPSLASLGLGDLPVPPSDLRGAAGRLRVPADDELAFVQFSSGSTSFPKGIPVRQDRLRANLTMITRTDLRVPSERVSSWLPLYHDMGLVGGLLSCLMMGGGLLLAEPLTFLADAFGWWEHMAVEGVAGTVIPNFAVDYSLKLLEGLDVSSLDLSGLRSVYLGSEPINIPNLLAFLDLMRPARLRRDVFMPCYGMAEAVLLVSSRPPGSPVRAVPSPSGVPAISVGRPMPEFTVRVRVDSGAGAGSLGEVELAAAAWPRPISTIRSRSPRPTVSTRPATSGSSMTASCSSPAGSATGSRSTARTTSPPTSSRRWSGCRSCGRAARPSCRAAAGSSC